MKTVFNVLAICLLMTTACQPKTDDMELQRLLDSIEDQVRPLTAKTNLAYWESATTGQETAFQEYTRASMALTKIYSDSATFEHLKQIRDRGKTTDSLLARQLEVVYRSFLANHADSVLLNEMIIKASELEKIYARFRADYRGRKITDNEVEHVLQNSRINKDLKDVWEAHKRIGREAAPQIIELVKLRNRLAVSLGFENYHSMSLELSGQDPQEISAIFDELDQMTAAAFAAVKQQIDAANALRYRVPSDKLMPWHYQNRYFQEAPQLYPVDFDPYYKGKDLEKITINFYRSIGIDISSIMTHSDLYEREGKNQHAFCTDIDGQSDIRVLCNISDNEKWMDTMLHEFGHGAYSLGHDHETLPWFLRNAATPFTTEGVAMLFGRLSRNPAWLQQNVGITEAEKDRIALNCHKAQRLAQLVSSRWIQVMYRFEKALYDNPDQDLNALWWQLVAKYQLLRKPEGRNEPDWASKIHIALYPCYYHNYQLGELFASQMHYYIVDHITKSGQYRAESYTGHHEIGQWLKEYVFTPGMRYEWNEMIRRATGEKLTAKYFAAQFIE